MPEPVRHLGLLKYPTLMISIYLRGGFCRGCAIIRNQTLWVVEGYIIISIAFQALYMKHGTKKHGKKRSDIFFEWLEMKLND
jgi:hypothetical protein